MKEKPTYEELEKEVYELRSLRSKLNNHNLHINEFIDDKKNITIEDLIKIADLQAIQDEFAKATGVAAIVTNPDGSYLTKPSNFCRLCKDIIRNNEIGLTNCMESSAAIGRYHPQGPIIQQCMSCGLWDAGSGISFHGQHLGNIIIGQVRYETQTEEEMIAYAEKIGVDKQIMLSAFREVPVMSREKFKDIANLLFTFSNQLSEVAYQNFQQKSLINKMKKTEKTLSKREKEISSIFRAAPTGIGVIINRVFIKVNIRFCEMTGYSKNELIGQNARLLYPNDEEYNYVGTEKYRQIKEKGTGSVETKFLCKNGKTIEILMSSTPLDLNDLSKGVTFTALDITALKKKESELLESGKKYRSMMEAMDEPTYICSSDYTVEYMNPAMLKRCGNDLSGEPCYKAIHELEKKCPWCILDKVINKEATDHEVTSPKDKRTYHISYSPIIHTDNSTSMLAILRDITDVKILQADLQQSQKMESIGTLAGGIAHDFNNILSPIFGFVELTLKKLPENSKEHNYLLKVLEASKRARDLVNQILTFSRKSEHILKPMEAQSVIKEALKLLRSSIPSTIEINQNISTDCGLIMADPVQIHQIIMNLGTNAYHAMEDKGGILSVSLEEIQIKNNDSKLSAIPLGQYLCLQITDNGHGMEQSVLDRIFDPYFTTKEIGKGTGLGLSVIHGIVKDCSGYIRVSSEPEKGTETNIYIPIINNIEKLKNTEFDPEFLYGTESILIIDDEEIIVQIQKEMLEMLGYKVTVKTDSLDALDIFSNKPDDFDLVITDMTMPKITGYKLAEEVKKIRHDIPIILCTGFSGIVSEKKSEYLGINGFLMKPVSMFMLSQKVREVIDTNKK